MVIGIGVRSASARWVLTMHDAAFSNNNLTGWRPLKAQLTIIHAFSAVLPRVVIG